MNAHNAGHDSFFVRRKISRYLKFVRTNKSYCRMDGLPCTASTIL